MKAAVVILNWNGKKFLQQFLPEVIRCSGGTEIIVADNASTDGSCEMLRAEFPHVTQLVNASNLGFAGGYNEALKKIDADYFILLNSDVEVTPNWIKPVIEMMERNKTISACQPKILSYVDKSYFEYAGAAGGFIDKYGYPFCRGRIFYTLEKDNGQYNDAEKIFWATGACLFVRASAFRKVNGFEEEFFAHMEEVDLCWRLQKAGGTIWYCPDSTIYHVGGGTLPKTNPQKTYLNFRNNLLMLYRNLPEREFKKVFAFRVVLDVLASFRFIFGPGKFAEAKAVWRAHRDFRKMKKVIRKTPAGDINSEEQIRKLIYPGSVLRDYFLKWKKVFSSLNF